MEDPSAAPPPPQVSWADPKLQQSMKISNPGKYDNLEKEVSAIMHLNFFDGVHLDIAKAASPIAFIGHHITMGSPTEKETYNFSSTFVPNQNNMLSGRISPQGFLYARIFRQLTPKITTKIEAQVPVRPKPVSVQFEADYSGPSYTVGGKCSNDGYVTASILKSVTPRLVIGGEGIYHPRMQGASFVSRYETRHFVGNALVGTYGVVNLSYMRKVNSRVGLATSLQVNVPGREVVYAAGYSFNLRQANVKARVDSNGTIGCILEEKITPNFIFSLSSYVDYSKQDYKFGFGVSIG
eukprot:c12743_g1_i1.p1 GENE.c12743_g1_i1~~c12743_g1_i1.p1  ORF type:complete len:295 (+),score=123.38 c12743_g1_i1:54-938(+)